MVYGADDPFFINPRHSVKSVDTFCLIPNRHFRSGLRYPIASLTWSPATDAVLSFSGVLPIKELQFLV